MTPSTLLVFLLLFDCTIFGYQRPQTRDEFYDAVTSGVYADKSLMAKEYLEEGTKINLIIRPGGWGKSTNLNMLKRFLEVEVDEEGRPLPIEKRENRRLFAGGEIRLFSGKTEQLKPLRIAYQESVMKFHQGRYPVIFLNFRDVTGGTYEEILKKTRSVLKNLFHQYRYLEVNLDPAERKQFQSYRVEELNEYELGNSLGFLSKLLGKRYGQTAHIFIDDYDTPIISLFVNKVKRSENTSQWHIYDEVLESAEFHRGLSLLRNILHNCFENERGLIAGKFALNITGKFDIFCNTSVYSVVNKKFSDFYGFFDEDIDRLLRRTTMKADREQIRSWYGYNFTGNATTYNPRWMRQFSSNKCEFRNYWSDDGDTSSLADDMLSSDEIQIKLQYLVDGGSVEGMVGNQIKFDRIWDELSILLHSGYVNPISRNSYVWGLSAPNRVVKDVCRKKILTWICEKFNLTADYFVSMASALTAFNIELFKHKLRQLTTSPALDCLSAGEAEIYYDGIVKSVTYFFRHDDYITEKYKLSGFTRLCYVLISKRFDSDDAIIIGYKMAEDAETLVKEAIAGLQQLALYEFNPAVDPYVERVLSIVLVFHGQQFDLQYLIDSRNHIVC